MFVRFDNQKCFVCNINNTQDQHHVIPKNLNPVNNILVGVCKECHDKINLVDTTSLNNYLISVSCQMDKLMCRVRDIDKRIHGKH